MKSLNIGLLALLIASLNITPAFAIMDFGQMPVSLSELVETSDVIMIGRLHKVESNQKFYGYQPDAENLAALDKVTPMPLGLYRTELSLKIQKILKGSEHVKRNKIVLGMITPEIIADLSVINRNMLRNKDKIDQQVFFLRKNPDSSYRLNTAMGTLHIKKNPVSSTRSNKLPAHATEQIVLKLGGQEYLPFEMQVSPDDFYTQIETLVQKQADD